jgi:hypothetical protein
MTKYKYQPRIAQMVTDFMPLACNHLAIVLKIGLVFTATCPAAGQPERSGRAKGTKLRKDFFQDAKRFERRTFAVGECCKLCGLGGFATRGEN